MERSKAATLEKNLAEDARRTEKSFLHLYNQLFCHEDAVKAARKWAEKHPLVELEALDTEVVRKKKGRGRPKNGEKLDVVIHVKTEARVNRKDVERRRRRLGRFILATNDLDLDAEVSSQLLQRAGSRVTRLQIPERRYFQGVERVLENTPTDTGSSNDHGAMPAIVQLARMEAAPKAEGKRHDGKKPDKKTSTKSQHEMGILSLLRDSGNTHKTRRLTAKKSGQPDGRTPENFKAARSQLRKIL